MTSIRNATAGADALASDEGLRFGVALRNSLAWAADQHARHGLKNTHPLGSRRVACLVLKTGSKEPTLDRDDPINNHQVRLG